MDLTTAILIDYVNKFIDTKYFSVKSVTNHYDYDDRVREMKEVVDPATVELNGYAFAELIEQIPDATSANITKMVENLSSLSKKNRIVGWGTETTTTGYSFFDTDSSIGAGTLTLLLHFCWDEDYCCCSEHDVEVKIDNVIYKNHKFYFLTKELEKWLSAEGKPRRKAALNRLFL